jgi:nuclear pore complex protein Nup205
MAAGFGEALQRKLLEVEGLYGEVRSRYTFIQALVRRIRGLLRRTKS